MNQEFKGTVPELPYLQDLPAEVVAALDVFRLRQQPIAVFVDQDTNEVLCIGDILYEDGVPYMMQFAEPEFAQAADVIKEYCIHNNFIISYVGSYV